MLRHPQQNEDDDLNLDDCSNLVVVLLQQRGELYLLLFAEAEPAYLCICPLMSLYFWDQWFMLNSTCGYELILLNFVIMSLFCGNGK